MARAPRVVSTHDVERKYGIKNELDDVCTTHSTVVNN